MILLFRATQQPSLQVQRDLEKWIGQHNGQEQAILPGITYGSYLEEMKTSYQKNLSDELLHKIETLDLTKNTIETLTKNMETQFDALAQVQVHLNLRDRESAKPDRIQKQVSQNRKGEFAVNKKPLFPKKRGFSVKDRPVSGRLRGSGAP